ncbi:MAG: TetR/AcrR family transcriptional regulator [Solirubrobacterales bacterium]
MLDYNETKRRLKMIENGTGKDLRMHDTKAKIVQATLEIISGEGCQQVTVRKIAAKAGVNVAAVNYHFGSKDMAVNEALKSVTAQIIGAFDRLSRTGESPRGRLYRFITEYMDAVYRHPDVIKNLVSQTLHNSNVAGNYQAYLEAEGIVLLSGVLSELYPDESDETLRMMVVQLIGCMSYPVILGQRMTAVSGINLEEPGQRDRYARLLAGQVVDAFRAR